MFPYRYILVVMMFGTSLWGSRIITLPPLAHSSSHGSFVDANRHCITADVNRHSDSVALPVRNAFHRYQVLCQDVSLPAKTQTVRISVLPSSFTTGSHSGGLGPPPLGNSAIVMPPVSPKLRVNDLSLSAGGLVRYSIFARCSQLGCSFEDDFGRFAGTPGDHHTAPGQVCIGIETLMALRIEILGTEGSVSCSVTTESHRGSGIKDNNLSTPPIYYVLGGQAF